VEKERVVPVKGLLEQEVISDELKLSSKRSGREVSN
jgi:hypothetical protein